MKRSKTAAITHVVGGESVGSGRPGGDGPEDGTFPDRYEDRGRIAVGGMGEIRRLYDTRLECELAVKLLHHRYRSDERARARFEREARITAVLQHPGIVAITDCGEFDDGRLWFTMTEVRGMTLRDAIDGVHTALESESQGGGWTLRRLIAAVESAARTVGYAHTQGIIHRDLKPDNIMVGAFGEVQVMDWGIARGIRGEETWPTDDMQLEEDTSDAANTQYGSVVGTPAYMPLEQAGGLLDAQGAWSDTYSLGCILYEVLAGVAPFTGKHAGEVWQQLISGPPTPLRERASQGLASLPDGLVEITERAMIRDIEGRYMSGTELADDLRDWLEAERRKQSAREELSEAAAQREKAAQLRQQATTERASGNAILDTVETWSPVERKLPAWAFLDRADRLEENARLTETHYVRHLRGALNHYPLPRAHSLLAEYHRDRLIEAEARGDHREASHHEVLLGAHDRGEHAAFLRGNGALTLVTDPPGAKVLLHRYTLKERRLVAVFERELGHTPLVQVDLERGSWLLTLEAPGRAIVRYPVVIGRADHWDGIPPEGGPPFPIYLPREDELGRDDCYVPAGWFRAGDPVATDGFSSRSLWVDGFVIRRHPVTVAEYLVFANALSAGEDTPYNLERDGQPLQLVADRDRWLLAPGGCEAEPIVAIGWRRAARYVQWLADVEGQAWLLPHDMEWEKAARGVDGRLYPWGDRFDPTWANTVHTTGSETLLRPTGSFPVDTSPYLVEGMCGNARDICANPYARSGPPDGSRIVPATAPAGAHIMVRGGQRTSEHRNARVGARFVTREELNSLLSSFRPCRRLGSAAPG